MIPHVPQSCYHTCQLTDFVYIVRKSNFTSSLRAHVIINIIMYLFVYLFVLDLYGFYCGIDETMLTFFLHTTLCDT